jgi:hypothetical protein
MLLATIVSLLSISREKPAAVAATGSFGGIFAFLVNWWDVSSKVFQAVTGFTGFLLAAISLLLVLPRFCRFVRNAFRTGFMTADKDPEP